ncbi:MAG: ATP-binding protein, partial [Oleibacter sp.]|nr:ATP-binding protein [Thalassolituus sp.]
LQPFISRSRQLQRNVMQMLALYRLPQAGSFSKEDAWPASTLRAAIDCVFQLYPDRQIISVIDEDLQGYYCDSLVQLAITSLLHNSLQMGATEVVISANETADYLVIQVDDNGPGFDHRILAGEIESLRPGGTGLGLNFSRMIAAHHTRGQEPHIRKGALLLSNRPEGGARVVLQLP